MLEYGLEKTEHHRVDSGFVVLSVPVSLETDHSHVLDIVAWKNATEHFGWWRRNSRSRSRTELGNTWSRVLALQTWKPGDSITPLQTY